MKFFEYARWFEYVTPARGLIVLTSDEVAACGASAGCRQQRTNLPTVLGARGVQIATSEWGEHFPVHDSFAAPARPDRLIGLRPRRAFRMETRRNKPMRQPGPAGGIKPARGSFYLQQVRVVVHVFTCEFTLWQRAL